jgi:hypothetical protein
MSGWAGFIRTGACVSYVALAAGCASGNIATVPGVPESLRVSDNQLMSLAVRGVGVQIYECQASPDDPHRFAWIFKAPEADLLDRAGGKIGTHYGGPTWEAADGSKVTGEIMARDSGPDPGAIPWLLLRATTTTGAGPLSRTQYIQRLHTVGGKAPSSACDVAEQGTRVRVPYTADYFFYSARS